MKIVVVGAVAAGTSAAAKARRNDKDAVIKIFEMDNDISYSGCGLPYYIGGRVPGREELAPRDPGYFKRKYNIDIYTRHEVLKIDIDAKSLTIKNLNNGDVFAENYDKLVVATGARPVVPDIKGIDKGKVFYLRNVDSADKIKEYIAANKPKSAVIVGTGFIGMELAENLVETGIDVTFVERLNQVMPALDSDMAAHLEEYLKSKGIKVLLNEAVTELRGDAEVNQVVLKEGKVVDTDFVVMAVGIRPNVSLAKEAGLEIGVTGAIKVNKRMQTSNMDIYACGDCAEAYSSITGKEIYRPLGTTANKMGRITGDQITYGNMQFNGVLGTGIFKVFDMAVAQTGFTERDAVKEGFDIVVSHDRKIDRLEYFEGKEMLIKAVAEKNTGRLLGVQIIGYSGVDKRIDVFATAITFGAKAEDLMSLDLAYSPPFSTTKDPVMYTGMILQKNI